MNNLKVIASYGICNTASLNIYAINDEKVLVGMNNDKPRWLKIYDPAMRAYFNYKKMGKIYLDMFCRVNM